MIIGKIFSAALKCGTKGYGKQIGKMSKNGLTAFKKQCKNGEIITVLDRNNQVVRTKNIFHSGDHTMVHSYDNKGNCLSYTEILKTPNGFGPASQNQFANTVRTVREEYNKMGQVIHKTDKTFTPLLSKPKAKVFSVIDGKKSLTWLNTLNNKKHTIRCLEK